jgi:hypothetical protein
VRPSDGSSASAVVEDGSTPVTYVPTHAAAGRTLGGTSATRRSVTTVMTPEARAARLQALEARHGTTSQDGSSGTVAGEMDTSGSDKV